MSEDWLSLGEITPTDQTMKPLPGKSPIAKLNTLRREHLKLKRKLPLPQRLYLDALIKTNFHYSNAGRIMTSAGYMYDKSTYTRWRQRNDLSKAIEVTKEYISASLGLNGDSTLAVAKQLADHGLDEVPILDRSGNPLIDPRTNEPFTQMRDPLLALKATELLGKNQKLWGNDQQSTRVTVNIVDLSGRENIEDIGQTYEGVVDDG